MSGTSRYRHPVMISCGSAFTEADNSELLDRHSRYGVAFREVSGNPRAVLAVLVPDDTSAGSLLADREALQVYSIGPHKNPLAIGLAAGRWARKRGLSPYWIAGTPFREAIAAITAQRFRQGPLQIQAHGNFGVLSPWSGPVSDRSRWLVARLTLPRANSVRTVSPEQQKHLLSTFRIDPEISFVAPVPVNPVFFDSASYPKPEDGIFRIGWFGRLHRERGFEEWIARTHHVAEGHGVIELHIIGDGPHKQELQAKIEKAFPHIRVVWWGKLSGKSIATAVSGLDLLINSCRNETFGRAMLEAVLQGVKVEAIDSPGIRNLRDVITLGDQSTPDEPSYRSEPAWFELSVPKDIAIDLVQINESRNLRLIASSWFAGD